MRIPIRVKITLWYTLLMFVLLIICSFTAIQSMDRISDSGSKQAVLEHVRESVEEIKFKKNEIKIKDDIDYFSDGVFIQIFDQNLNMIGGYSVTGTESFNEFEHDKISKLNSGGKSWYVYTLRVNNDDDYRYVWVRGIVDVTGMANYSFLINLVILALTIAIITLGLIVGYFIAKRLTMPIREINTTLGEIRDAKDLTKRINIKSRDEIGEMAQFFNEMLDRLSLSFERERTFTSDVSHELRTPLAVINSECEYALSLPNSEETTECINTVKEQSDKMYAIISQLLFLARTENGTEQMKFETVDYSMIADCAVDDAEIAAVDKNIKVTRNIESGINVKGDQLLLTRLLINLISNGIKYNKDNGTLDITVTKENNMAVTTVKDSGIGIPAESLERIWDRFYRVDSSRTKNDDESTGLGLPMVKIIAHAHGGYITVSSTVGEGTTFVFYIPAE